MAPWEVLAEETPRGLRYRYRCSLCGHRGPQRVNPNDADGDSHLYHRHQRGD